MNFKKLKRQVKRCVGYYNRFMTYFAALTISCILWMLIVGPVCYLIANITPCF